MSKTNSHKLELSSLNDLFDQNTQWSSNSTCYLNKSSNYKNVNQNYRVLVTDCREERFGHI